MKKSILLVACLSLLTITLGAQEASPDAAKAKEIAMAQLAALAEGKVLNEPVNGDFETGDLTGWTVVSGTAFGQSALTADQKFWDTRDFNQHGKFHVTTLTAGENAIGRIRSTTFTLAGEGKIQVLLGAGKEARKAYVALVDASNDQLLLKQGNTRFKDPEFSNNYQNYEINASKYKGKAVYVLVIDDDNRPGDFAFLNVDYIRVK